jgi:hypothetical protein
VNGEPLAASRRPPGSTTKLSICEVPVRVPMRWSPKALKNTSPRPELSGTVYRRARDRGQRAVGAQPEAGVAAAARAGVRHVDQAGRGDRDADRLDPARGHRLATEHRHAARGDAQDRDLVAAGVDRQQVAAIGGGLDRALGGQAGAQPRAAGRERGAGQRGDRAVGVPGEPVDGVGGGGVAVDVGVADHRRWCACWRWPRWPRRAGRSRPPARCRPRPARCDYAFRDEEGSADPR